MLKRMIERETADTFDLNNRVSIEIHVASFRSSRGYTVISALCDEIAFWRSEESANPDKGILNSLRPAMATIPGSIMLCASSPYAQRGEMWNANRRHYGQGRQSGFILGRTNANHEPERPPTLHRSSLSG